MSDNTNEIQLESLNLTSDNESFLDEVDGKFVIVSNDKMWNVDEKFIFIWA